MRILAEAKGRLIPLLQETQAEHGYIPRELIPGIARETGVAEAEIFGVITFYSQFRLKPMGKYVVRVCAGTACHVSGGHTILEVIEDELGVKVGETTEDGLFTLFTVACIGCCSLAPVIMINEDTHGKLTAASVRKLFKGIRRSEQTAMAGEHA